jgi:hypothetical protein
MKHLRAAPKIEISCLIDAVSERDERRDNRSSACAGDVIEIVGKDHFGFPLLLRSSDSIRARTSMLIIPRMPPPSHASSFRGPLLSNLSR